jgi:hypothetical protein
MARRKVQPNRVDELLDDLLSDCQSPVESCSDCLESQEDRYVRSCRYPERLLQMLLYRLGNEYCEKPVAYTL